MNADRTRRAGLRPPVLAPALWLACLAAAWPSPQDTGSRPHLVVLTDGDRLQGRVTGFSQANGLTLSHPDAAAPITLRWGSVLSLASTAPGDVDLPESKAVLGFIDGDSVPADITTFDGSVLGVTTPWAGGSHQFAWDQVARVVFSDDQSKRLFLGPLPSQDWRFTGPSGGADEEKPGNSPGGWSIDKNELLATSPGSASIDARLPDQVMVDFDVEWTGHLNFSVALFSDAFLPADPEKPDDGLVVERAAKDGSTIPLREGVALDVNPHAVILRTHSPDNGQDMLGSAQMPQKFRSRSKARLTLRADRKAGNFAVWQDGKLVHKWTEVGTLPGEGRAISFWQHHDSGSLTIQRVTVKSWNGKFEDELPEGETTKDVLIAADGSRLNGTLKSFDGAQWKIHGGVGDLAVNHQDIRHLVRAKGSAAPAVPAPSGTRVTLVGGSSFHLQEVTLGDDGKLTGRHAILGALAFPLSVVEAIAFSQGKPADAAAATDSDSP